MFRFAPARALFQLIFSLSLATAVAAQVPTTGRIAGRIFHAENGLPVADVAVSLDHGSSSTSTDLEGRFAFDAVAPGDHALSVERTGFTTASVTDVVVYAGEARTIELPLQPVERVIKMEAITVSADVLQNSGVGLLRVRQRAAAVSDAIGNQQMSRLGFGTAAAAMRAVTGASVVGGKYVYIRGLGERYSSTQVNGVELPSADPDRRAVNLDMFPSDLVDAIVTTKTFTPDKPGNFTGGAVDLKTKEFPEQFTFSLSASVAANSRISGEDFLTAGAGSNRWAKDDGSRALPAELASARLPLRFSAPGIDQEIGQLTRRFSPVMTPRLKEAPMAHSFAAAAGGVAQLLGRKLGYAASLSYDRSYGGYTGGFYGRYERQGVTSPRLSPLVEFTDHRSEDDALIGGLLNFTYQLSPDHQFAFNTMVNQAGNDMARRQTGLNVSGGGISETEVFTTRTLRYTERSLRSFQLVGKHLFPQWRELRVEWNATDATTTQDEPDVRFFSTFARPDGSEYFEVSGVPRPARYFRDLEESRRDYSLDVTLPVPAWGGRAGAVKVGGAWAATERDFNERLFEYSSTALRYDGDDQGFLRESQVGQVDPVTGRFLPGQLYLQETSSSGNSYQGDMNVAAYYAMLDWPATAKLRVVAGARAESTEIDVGSKDPARGRGRIDEADLLPSLNFTYALTDKMNLRAAITRTLARPNFREIADYTSFEFVGAPVLVGNPDLRRTLVRNYDLRWEWFPRKSELIAVSVFHKDLTDPIERVVFSTINASEFQYKNAPSGEVNGVELELRKQLDFVARWLRHFSGGLNYTYVDAAVDITADELASIRAFDPEAASTRGLAGQSEFVFNADVTFHHADWGTTLSAYFNVFGERIAEVSPPGTPNVYEQPAPTLDLVWNQKLGHRWKLTLSARNVLDRAVEETYTYRAEEYLRSSYRRGVTTSLGVSYTF